MLARKFGSRVPKSFVIMAPASLGSLRCNAMPRHIYLKAFGLSVLIAGSLDISDALIFYGLRGTPPRLLLQVIASGLLGPLALHLGLFGALIGLAIHYTITATWTAIFLIAARRFSGLLRFALPAGAGYGVLIYVVMNYLVLPVTRVVAHPVFTLPVFVNAVLALVFLMGIPIAVVSKAVLRKSTSSRPA